MQAAIEAVKVALQKLVGTSAEAVSGSRNETTSMGPMLGEFPLKQLSFNCSVTEKYAELRNYGFEINYIFQTYDINHAGREYQLLKTD